MTAPSSPFLASQLDNSSSSLIQRLLLNPEGRHCGLKDVLDSDGSVRGQSKFPFVELRLPPLEPLRRGWRSEEQQSSNQHGSPPDRSMEFMAKPVLRTA